MANELKFTLSLTTPAFLGRADQTAEWRTPPLKALLRQMYRLAHARNVQYSHARLADDEALLFGAAAGNSGTRSRIVLRLTAPWAPGAITTWGTAWRKTVHHPEVRLQRRADERANPAGQAAASAANQGRNRGSDIDALLYLGYGPLNDMIGQTTRGSGRRRRSALAPGEQSASLLVSLPTDITTQEHEDLLLAFRLMHILGTVGGRSRNAWGSLHIQPAGELRGNVRWPDTVITDAGQLNDVASETLRNVAREWTSCLNCDWPHAVGSEENGKLLVWVTKDAYETWPDAMQELARVKIALRTQFAFGQNEGRVPRRCVLAYPVTHHGVRGWPPELRIPNQLRFKVVQQPNGKLRGFIIHTPWRPTQMRRGRVEKKIEPAVEPELATEVWRRVHEVLDAPDAAISRCQPLGAA